MKDAPFSDDKFSHFFCHFWFVVAVGAIVGYEAAIGLSILIGLLWEFLDLRKTAILIEWRIVKKLYGAPFAIGGSGKFSGWDLLYNLLGALTPAILGCWPT